MISSKCKWTTLLSSIYLTSYFLYKVRANKLYLCFWKKITQSYIWIDVGSISVVLLLDEWFLDIDRNVSRIHTDDTASLMDSYLPRHCLRIVCESDVEVPVVHFGSRESPFPLYCVTYSSHGGSADAVVRVVACSVITSGISAVFILPPTRGPELLCVQLCKASHRCGQASLQARKHQYITNWAGREGEAVTLPPAFAGFASKLTWRPPHPHLRS